MQAASIPPLIIRKSSLSTDRTDLISNSLLPLVDYALDLTNGFLRRLPESYRKTIGSRYLCFLHTTEEQNNSRYDQQIQKVRQAFEKAHESLKATDPKEFNALWNFCKLQTEEDLLDEELLSAFGPTVWGPIDLKKREQEYTRNRWLIVLVNQSQLSDSEKKEQVEKIVHERFDDTDIIELLLPTDDQKFAKEQEDKKKTIFGRFVQNAYFYNKKSAQAILKEHKIKSLIKQACPDKVLKKTRGKLHKATKELSTLPIQSRQVLLLHSYTRMYVSMMALRTQVFKKICKSGEYRPYDKQIRFPQEALDFFQKASPRVTEALKVSPRNWLLKADKAQLEEFYQKIFKCFCHLKDFLTLLNIHVETDFDAPEKQLADTQKVNMLHSISTLTLEDTLASPKAKQQLANAELIAKLKANYEAFAKVRSVFQRIHRLAKSKPNLPFSL